MNAYRFRLVREFIGKLKVNGSPRTDSGTKRAAIEKVSSNGFPDFRSIRSASDERDAASNRITARMIDFEE